MLSHNVNKCYVKNCIQNWEGRYLCQFLCPYLHNGIPKKKTLEVHFCYSCIIKPKFSLVKNLPLVISENHDGKFTVLWKSYLLVFILPRMNYLKKLKMKSLMKLSVWARLHQNIGKYLILISFLKDFTVQVIMKC